MSSVTTPVTTRQSETAPFVCIVCQRPLKAFEAFVPDLRALYRMLCDTGVQQNYPLTQDQLATVTRCKKHAHAPGSRKYLKEHGIERMYALAGTLALMEQWRVRNEEAKNRQRLRSDCIMNRLFGGVRPVDKPNPKHRIRKRPPKQPKRIGPKRYGDERRPSAESKEKKKGKQQNDKKNAKGNGKGRH